MTAPGYNSTGLESGRNILRGCSDHTVDMALAKRIRLPGQKSVQLRMDVFNLFNTYIINAWNTSVQLDNPTSMTVVNSEYNSDGSINQSRLTPRTAGFGAATGAQTIGLQAGLGRQLQPRCHASGPVPVLTPLRSRIAKRRVRYAAHPKFPLEIR